MKGALGQYLPFEITSETYKRLLLLHAGFSIFSIAAKFWVQQTHLAEVRFYEKCRNVEAFLTRYRAYFGASLSFCDAVGLLGFALVLVTGRTGGFLTAVLVSAVLFVTNMPNVRKMQDLYVTWATVQKDPEN